ncbi:hypothetical protein T9A_01847 [Alcanivorax jadensis T9]|jgi:hypothetical protein|uniref:DUF2271 domain-containing protein n=1 Tax=Alcanivorax jadensis T9 TaxID=1177181 RepID=A0ABR4WC25_9GAMM|nr:DUF2271 domain-containing protein [Alcanivorax jadensis]KGD60987.1 hypothetical protein T9A_01847 [Alcanivorax jadensis T9]MBP21255.1 DUF2271 domain-containing protein [Alcanivorax sp.]|tara:strand:- start:105 stop:593 length:489 start_codon:yes stop_codon:yes gene_type:complete
MRLLPLALFSLLASYASADTFQVEVEVPRLRVAEYHAPYVAFWVENADRSTIVPLGLWYDDQEKWLKDIRQWWRRTGRGQQKPYDGLTGATRSPGKHQMDFSELQSLQKLPADEYQLVVEASREVGGREVVRLPFQWPASNHQQQQVNGTSELGTVTLSVRP